jgi:hypothetical protein
MNLIETDKIRRVLKEWGERCVRDDQYPVLLITMASETDIRIEPGGLYSIEQIKKLLQKVIDSLPS